MEGWKLLIAFGWLVSTSEGDDPKNILILGGNGFIGAATSERLIAKGNNLVLLNRGNWYWDSQFTVKPHVKHLTCDRQRQLLYCEDLHRLKDTVYFDVVIDFSAYHFEAVEDVLELLKGKIGRYIYISSDSVYEVCQKNHSEPSQESDAVRPFTSEERLLMTGKDDYGHRKLECEEVLVKQRKEGGVPYVLLRLPDVIGPRDNTYRWWMYQMWLKLSGYLERQISIPKFLLNQKLSFVYSLDVADMLVQLTDSDLKNFDNAYNLGTDEMPTLLEVLESMRKHLRVENIPIPVNDSNDAIYLFPSVKLGPIDSSKAKTLLNWRPTSFDNISKQTISFYESAIRNKDFDLARKEIIKNMQAYFTKQPHNVLYGLNGVYGIKYPDTHEEL
ncbi:uncharacterized protein LOC110443058 [Mizuhopecten yessoensis]|uniref:NAD-dependent epimerase/dehydratase domain-containing protein n=1 Tax=Mizuhopecten yessoensis TaxID=6573 RepID=A0A210PFR3_MIZYE|nr:uncharacterized protein LOC110443058 [Mizuhopecten yessoensis]OWF35330.1 hypothetical protein KP79_PYT03898 [Mizuhopecten yessoensis]